ncbi:DUF302 domain-containing protein [Geothrix edaphica]|uniref:DUF302 domain-containing protein n=1 Tax=Geothrix edaphica TaxID=2927976 RepID=A0ABQ5PZU8_9BACT|nr:DUF302 domain-containing protein [Geothrix edaphica]GLH68005.1 hypothetical protein GETHED_23690 [Geothrix edaphica]
MSYCMTKILKGDPAEVDAKVRKALADQGFGILSEIDVEATLRAKLGAEVGLYRILGACNPAFAKGALELEPRVGVMLPCNVILRGVEGGIELSFVDPVASMAAIDNPGLKHHAEAVRAKLQEAFKQTL